MRCNAPYDREGNNDARIDRYERSHSMFMLATHSSVRPHLPYSCQVSISLPYISVLSLSLETLESFTTATLREDVNNVTCTS
ncbi:hypothetical protein [Argonema antarcticum]|uniref:hypothetical protein n=1 Tax=Argonema antarcticum TaxID=2942763 RepID=UPI002012BB35|nr:hypothetical protein [Argonema antarcticum]MCL1473861.1 hypothetical protein [Argonema antarcticum A004/B2]